MDPKIPPRQSLPRVCPTFRAMPSRLLVLLLPTNLLVARLLLLLVQAGPLRLRLSATCLPVLRPARLHPAEQAALLLLQLLLHLVRPPPLPPQHPLRLPPRSPNLVYTGTSISTTRKPRVLIRLCSRSESASFLSYTLYTADR